METSIQKLKGKVIETPKEHKWRINKQVRKSLKENLILTSVQENRNYRYTVENEDSVWTPFNSNLQMQGIKVIIEW